MKPLLISIAILTVAVPVAGAAKFRGQTSQDRKAVVAMQDGVPVRVTIFWEAPCGDGRLTDETSFLPRFDESTGTFVRDRGDYTTKITDEDGRAYRFRADARVRGRQITDDKWRGRFRVSGELRRKGEVVTRCDSGRIRWRATT
jgi:hypothetical protein